MKKMVASAAGGSQDLQALVCWLQTFPVFDFKVIDGEDGEVAAETVFETLSSLEAAR
jgi:hypothetical protein